MTFKNIIPDLVSLETKLKRLNGCYLAESFDLFPPVKKKSRFHYQVIIDDNINPPRDFDLQNGYYFKKKHYWYYQRRIFGPFYLRFCYNQKNRVLRFNRLFRLVPFEIGRIQPIGKHLADLISVELFLEMKIVSAGVAFTYKNKCFVLVAPSFNGKTTVLNYALARGGSYIAENVVVLDLKNKLVYPTACEAKNITKSARKDIVNNRNGRLADGKRKYDELILYQNTLNPNYVPAAKTIADFLFLKSLLFLSNNFLLSYIFGNSLTARLLNVFRVLETEENKAAYRIKKIINFDIGALFK